MSVNKPDPAAEKNLRGALHFFRGANFFNLHFMCLRLNNGSVTTPTVERYNFPLTKKRQFIQKSKNKQTQ